MHRPTGFRPGGVAFATLVVTEVPIGDRHEPYR